MVQRLMDIAQEEKQLMCYRVILAKTELVWR